MPWTPRKQLAKPPAPAPPDPGDQCATPWCAGDFDDGFADCGKCDARVCAKCCDTCCPICNVWHCPNCLVEAAGAPALTADPGHAKHNRKALKAAKRAFYIRCAGCDEEICGDCADLCGVEAHTSQLCWQCRANPSEKCPQCVCAAAAADQARALEREARAAAATPAPATWRRARARAR